MSDDVVQRWEDVIPHWRGPAYPDLAVPYHDSVAAGPVSGAITSSTDIVDWDGNGGCDLVVSSWDACYEGVVRLYRDRGSDRTGLPVYGAGPVIEGVMGQTSVVREDADFGLLAASRLRPALHLFRNAGSRSAPKFEAPEVLALDCDWMRTGELIHRAMFADIDGDGRQELVVGTDFWGDYWPDGVEWFEEGYTPYTDRGVWRGGPLRGFLYVFPNAGTPLHPVLGKGRPLRADGHSIEVYGMASPAFGDFRGTGRLDLVCGDFLDRLHFFPNLGEGRFGAGSPVRDAAGDELVLGHCIHAPTAVTQGVRADLLIAAEDGQVHLLRNSGKAVDGVPAFESPILLNAKGARIHAGILPVPAVADWSGDGRDDLILGNSAGDLVFLANLGTAERPSFGLAMPLRAGGKTINIRAGLPGSLQGPSEVKFGYTCPAVADWNGDGVPDLLVSSVRGEHLFFRCNREGVPPEFDEGRFLTYQGQPLRTAWRVRPAVADWKGDGALSYLSLDEDGVLAAWRRASDTVLEDKRLLTFADGTPIRFTEDFGGGLGRIKLCLCDWTGSGLLDLVIGTHGRASVPPGPVGQPRHTTGQAAVLWMRNTGTPDDPRFAPPRPIRYHGEPIQIGMHACAPEAVNWRARPLPDLLVGAEDGSLLWFRREDLSW